MRNALTVALVSGLWACGNPAPISPTTSGSITGGSTIGLSNGSTVSAAATAGSSTSGSSATETAAGSTTGGAGTGTATATTSGAVAGTTSAASGTTSGTLPPVPDPTINGRYSVIQKTAEITSSQSGDTIPVIYDYPTSSPDAGVPATRSCPLVIFAHGFLIDASAYEVYANRLSSFGYVVVLPNYPDANELTTNANDDAFVQDLMAGLAFGQGTLPESDPDAYDLVDQSEVGISGHSLGGKLAILAAEQNAGSFQASINFDPVDDVSCGANCPSATASLGSLHIPTAFLGETTDQSGGGIFGGACAPASENFQVFYNAAQSPSLQGTVTGAGSESFLDDQNGCGLGLGCMSCTSGASANTLDISHGMLVAFYERYLRNKTGYDAWLNGSLSTSTWVTPGEITLLSK